jgi:hypothetical protein
MFTNNLRRKSRGLGQRNRLRKLTRRGFYFMRLSFETFGECFEKRNVRRICKIDPETHRQSPLDLDQPAAIAQRRLGCFDHTHEAQSCWSIRLGLLVVFDAVDEMQCLGL